MHVFLYTSSPDTQYIFVILFPQPICLENLNTRVHLTNVSLIVVTEFPRLVFLATRKYGRS